MVQLYVFNPVQKLRFLSRLFYRGSKRLIHGQPDHLLPPSYHTPSAKPHLQEAHRVILKAHISSAVVRDPEFYKNESEGGFCIFQVENTLFKIHRCFLQRESSAFGDMFALPRHFDSAELEGLSDEHPIPLADKADQFRDFLWALYAVPSDLCRPTAGPSIEKLLNIAELANKYCFASYESWATDRILFLAKEPTSFLCQASPEICARVLRVAVLCDDQKLLELVTRRLTARILWSNIDCRPILEVAQRYGLHTLQGIVYYKELVELEQVSFDGRSMNQPLFPENMDIEKRMAFLSAHHSLVAQWEQIRTTPPTFVLGGCAAHTECFATWAEAWTDAGTANHTLRCGSADVLGRLKSMMISLRKTLPEKNGICVSCTLAALESITTRRDQIIQGLIDHFCIR